MTNSAMEGRLAGALGCAPSTVQQLALPPEKIAHLLEAFTAAQKHQRSEMEKAIQAALGHLPALVRGPVIRILRS